MPLIARLKNLWRPPFDRLMAGVPARHKELSAIMSADDEISRPTDRLFEVAIEAVRRARSVKLTRLDARQSAESRWYETWPGEHYKLLAGLVSALDAHNVIEIGTFTGMGTLALAEPLPSGSKLTTFDLAAWDSFGETWLNTDDFTDGRIRQELANIAEPGGIQPYAELFNEADFIFVDGPKDGITEQKFIDALGSLALPKNPIVMFDDTRVMNMIKIWRGFHRPKMDLTSFGHWSGTALVDWNG